MAFFVSSPSKGHHVWGERFLCIAIIYKTQPPLPFSVVLCSPQDHHVQRMRVWTFPQNFPKAKSSFNTKDKLLQLPPSSSTAQSSDRGRRRPQSSKLSSKKDLAYNVWKSKKDFRSDLRAGPGFTLAERTQTSLEEHLEARKVIPLWGRDRLKSHFKAQPRFNFCPRLPKHLALGHKSKAIMGPENSCIVFIVSLLASDLF